MFTQEMPAMSEIETAGLNQCFACSVELLERDKFCRRCGVSQRLGATPVKADYETRQLPGLRLSGSFSGALITLVAQSVAEGAAPLGGNRWTMRLIGALAVIPLWLMIALLSPLEAYLAAKSIATQSAMQQG